MPRRKRNFRWVKWLVFLVLSVVAIAMVVLVKNSLDVGIRPNEHQNTNINKEEKHALDTSENNSTDNKEENLDKEEKVPQYEGESPNKSETLTGLISYADVVNNELIIRVNIDQFLQSGNCNLIISKNGVIYYTQSVAIQESVTTSTCDGYKVSVSDLSEGDFQVEIDLESSGKSGKITGRVRI